MGLLDFLSPALTVATNAAGTYQNAEAQANQTKIGSVIQSLQLARQQRQAEIENALKIAQTGKTVAEGQTYSPEYAGLKAGAEAAGQWPYTVQKINQEHQDRLSEIQAQGGNAMAVAQENDRARQALQDAQQQFVVQTVQPFQANQGDLNRTAANQRTGTQVQGHLQGIHQTQSGQVLPILESWVGRGPLANSDSSPASPQAVSPTASTKPPIQQRAQQLKSLGLSQAAAKQQLMDEGYTDDDTHTTP